MKGRIVFVAASMLALAACGSQDNASQQASDGASQSAKEMQRAAAALETPEPGQYQHAVEITALEMPGMPPEAANQMKAGMSAQQAATICVTKEEAERGYRDMFKDLGKGGECAYSKFDVSGGKLDARMECQSSDNGKLVMTFNGTVKRESADIIANMDVTGGAQQTGVM